MIPRRKRSEQRILVYDVEENTFVFVSRREAGLYYAAYQRPPGAEIIDAPAGIPGAVGKAAQGCSVMASLEFLHAKPDTAAAHRFFARLDPEAGCHSGTRRSTIPTRTGRNSLACMEYRVSRRRARLHGVMERAQGRRVRDSQRDRRQGAAGAQRQARSRGVRRPRRQNAPRMRGRNSRPCLRRR